MADPAMLVRKGTGVHHITSPPHLLLFTHNVTGLSSKSPVSPGRGKGLWAGKGELFTIQDAVPVCQVCLQNSLKAALYDWL